MTSWIDDVIKHVRDYDASRPRSLQAQPGWSEVGGCRAYLGFRLDGAWPTDDTDTWGAIRGTAIHGLPGGRSSLRPGVPHRGRHVTGASPATPT